MESITRINGNGQPYTLPMPKIAILTKEINNTALAHIEENTGLKFTRSSWYYESQPTTSTQITALILTYNFKTEYHNNASNHNTLFLKFDHHVGFKIDSICFDCCEYNHINTSGLEKSNRLAC
jgi:hypothetical protein